MRAALSLLAIALLAGCPVPIPPLGYAEESRHNLPDRAPEFIISGKTTRAEVLLSLGAPDRAAENESWFAYHSASHRGGVAFVAGGSGQAGALTVLGYRERRLVLRFDDDGVVKDLRHEERLCPHYGLAAPNAFHESGPCLDLEHLDLVALSAEAPTEALMLVLTDAIWVRSRGCPAPGQIPGQALAFRGSIALSSGSVVFNGREIRLLGGETPQLTETLGLTRIDSISVSNWPERALEILIESGTCWRIQAMDAGSRHPDQAALERFQNKLSQASGKPVRPR